MNVDRKPYYARDGEPPPPGPVTDPGQEGEYEVEQLLNRKHIRGRMHYLVRWKGHAPADDSWEPVEHLTNCAERIAEYEAAAPRRPKARRAATSQTQVRDVASSPSIPPPPSPPTGWTLGAWKPPGLGDAVLYWWPDDGWQQGRVAKSTTREPFTHVVRYRRPGATFTGDVEKQLDAASHGARWRLLVPAATNPGPPSLLPSAIDRAGSERP